MSKKQAVRPHLLELHRALLASERREYERIHGRLPDAAFLEALISDKALAWLSALTTLLVSLDEQPADPLAQEPALADWTQLLRSLLKADASGSAFHRKYADALQRSPDVVVAHGRLMGNLPAARPSMPPTS